MLLRALSRSPEYNLAHTGEIRTDLAHGGVGAHLATSPLGALWRAPSGDVYDYPLGDMHRAPQRRGQGPSAAAHAVGIVVGNYPAVVGSGVGVETWRAAVRP